MAGKNRSAHYPSKTFPKEVNPMPHSRSKNRFSPFRFAVWLLLFFGWPFPGWLGAEEAAIPGPEVSASQGADEETLHIGHAAGAGDLGLAFTQKIYPAAFGRAGKQVRISPMPGERSLIEANSGRLDGDAARFGSAKVENQYPNLIRVQEPLLVSSTSVFSIQFSANIRNWSDIVDLSPGIVYVRGYKLVESRLSAMGLKQRAFHVADHGKALRFLMAGRADVLISTEPAVRSYLSRREFRNAGIHRIGVLEKNALHLYLHKRHAELAGRMAEILREMKADGTYRRLFQEFTQNLGPEHTEGYWLSEEEIEPGNPD
jgi:hypothetical protein